MKTRRHWYSASAVLAATVLAVTAVAAPASAAGSLATGKIGSRPAVLLSNTWSSVSPNEPTDSAITVTANFTNHTTNTVKLTSFRVCYSGPKGNALAYHPYITTQSGVVWNYNGYKTIDTGACRTFDIPNGGRTFTKKADGEMFVIVSQVQGLVELLAGYYR